MKFTKEEIKKGEKIVKSTIERVTLRTFRIGCEKTNYDILQSLPSNVNELMVKFNMTKMPMNKRLNELEQAALLHRDRYKGGITLNPLGTELLRIIEQLQKEVLTILPDII